MNAAGGLRAGPVALVFGADLTAILKQRLARGAMGVFAVRVAATVLALVTGVILARALHLREYGIYVVAMAWAHVLAVPAAAGLDRLLVREVAVYQSRADRARLRGLLRWSTAVTLGVSVVVALVAAAVFAGTGVLRPAVRPVALLGLALVPLVALLRLRQSALQGLRHVVVGHVPDSLVRPVLMLGGVGIAWLVVAAQPGASGAMALMLLATAAALVTAHILLVQRLPPWTEPPAYDRAAWRRAAMPLSLLTVVGALSVHLDVLMLGALHGPAAAGVFRVADRGAQLVTFGTIVIGTALAPTLAALHAEARREQLQRLVTRSARASFLIALPVGLALIVLGRWFLLLFGPEFHAAYGALVVLTVAQLVSAFAGTVNTVLIMAGHEREVAAAVGAGTLLNAALNAVLIPRWGAAGAAVATLVRVVVIKAVLVVLARRHTGLATTGLAPLAARGPTAP